MYKYIIWDFDGTLHDTYPGITQAFEEALRDYDIEEDRKKIFKEVKKSIRHAKKYFADKYSLNEESLNDSYKGHARKLPPALMAPYPYAREVCTAFKNAGGRNFIYTHRDDSTIEYLEEHDMLGCFEDVITSKYGFVKPNPDGFLHIINKYGLSKDEGLGVGDRDLDIIAAEQAGLATCLVNNDGLSYESKPDFVIASLGELNKILGLS